MNWQADAAADTTTAMKSTAEVVAGSVVVWRKPGQVHPEAAAEAEAGVVETAGEREGESPGKASPEGRGAAKGEGNTAGGSNDRGGGTGDGGEAFKIFIKYGDKTKRARVEVLP